MGDLKSKCEEIRSHADMLADDIKFKNSGAYEHIRAIQQHALDIEAELNKLIAMTKEG